ncbi:MAG: TonB family protein [Proteobacteria bacterium]|nr:TonB family protein [Pseudomonadota bacterium]
MIGGLVVLALQVAGLPGAPAEASAPAVTPPVPHTGEGSDEYPPEAVRLKHQGSVEFTVQVGADGRPVSCAIRRSSGYPELDAASCAAMMKRGFDPALDAKRKPVAGAYAGQIAWTLPQERTGQSWQMQADYPLEAERKGHQGVVYYAIQVSREGRSGRCIVTLSSGWPELDSATCQLISARARFTPGTNEKGEPVASIYAARVRWALPGGRPFQSVDVDPKSLIPPDFAKQP